MAKIPHNQGTILQHLAAMQAYAGTLMEHDAPEISVTAMMLPPVLEKITEEVKEVGKPRGDGLEFPLFPGSVTIRDGQEFFYSKFADDRLSVDNRLAAVGQYAGLCRTMVEGVKRVQPLTESTP